MGKWSLSAGIGEDAEPGFRLGRAREMRDVGVQTKITLPNRVTDAEVIVDEDISGQDEPERENQEEEMQVPDASTSHIADTVNTSSDDDLLLGAHASHSVSLWRSWHAERIL